MFPRGGSLTQNPDPVSRGQVSLPLEVEAERRKKEITRSLGSRKEVWPGNSLCGRMEGPCCFNEDAAGR